MYATCRAYFVGPVVFASMSCIHLTSAYTNQFISFYLQVCDITKIDEQFSFPAFVSTGAWPEYFKRHCAVKTREWHGPHAYL